MNVQFIFVVYSTRYGRGAASKICCPRDAMNISLTTQKCHGRFFSGHPSSQNGNDFLTSPRMGNRQDDGAFHPLRVMARILLGGTVSTRATNLHSELYSIFSLDAMQDSN
jgi:hypothetical protein